MFSDVCMSKLGHRGDSVPPYTESKRVRKERKNDSYGFTAHLFWMLEASPNQKRLIDKHHQQEPVASQANGELKLDLILNELRKHIHYAICSSSIILFWGYSFQRSQTNEGFEYDNSPSLAHYQTAQK